MTDAEAKVIAKIAAQEALRELFMRLGVDVDQPIEVQKDLAFVRAWRESSNAIRRQGIVVVGGIVVIMVAGLLGLIWATIRG